MIRAILPLRTVSEANRREHWAVVRRRTTEHRKVCAMALRAYFLDIRYAPTPLAVTLTRLAPRELDDDNLRGALKGVRDGVADALGVDDRDSRVEWRYAQERGAPKTYAVRIEVVPR